MRGEQAFPIKLRFHFIDLKFLRLSLVRLNICLLKDMLFAAIILIGYRSLWNFNYCFASNSLTGDPRRNCHCL